MTRRKLCPAPDVVAALAIFGSQIQIARTRLGLTAEELGDRVGVSARTVRSVEKGEPNPNIGNAFAVALAAGVDLFGTGSRETRAELAEGHRQTVLLLPQRVTSV
ncbi:MAG: helix-turn-helix domain-containing protein, partial [Promicromonosporaceae bacterium]|nr:helix-turn-helix domain-containing protein [Promicromonosporaceae bacterium]